MERETGIEPASSAWKADALPLCYSRLSDIVKIHKNIDFYQRLRQNNVSNDYT